MKFASQVKEKFETFQVVEKAKARKKLFERNRVLFLSADSKPDAPEVPLLEIQTVNSFESLYSLRLKLLQEHFNEEHLLQWAHDIGLVDQLLYLKDITSESNSLINPLALEVMTLVTYLSQQLTHELMSAGLLASAVRLIIEGGDNFSDTISWALSLFGNVINDCTDCEQKILAKGLVDFLKSLIAQSSELFTANTVFIEKLAWIFRSMQAPPSIGEADDIFEYFLVCLEIHPKLTSALTKVLCRLLPAYSFRQKDRLQKCLTLLFQANCKNARLQKWLLSMQRQALERQLDLPPAIVLSYIRRNINTKELASEAQRLLSTVIAILREDVVKLDLVNDSFLKTLTQRIYKPHAVAYKQLCVENLCDFAIHITDVEFLDYFFNAIFNVKLIAEVIANLFKDFDAEGQAAFVKGLGRYLAFFAAGRKAASKGALKPIVAFLQSAQASPHTKVYKQAYKSIRCVNRLLVLGRSSEDKGAAKSES